MTEPAVSCGEHRAGSDASATAAGQPVSRECPIACLRAVVPARALNRVYQLRPAAPRTIGELADICVRGGLDGIRNLGPSGIAEINGALTAAGLLHEHSRPEDGAGTQ
jgi:hypothetical protein